MKRPYKKRRKSVRINYPVLIGLVVAVIVTIVIVVFGIKLIIGAFSNDSDNNQTQTQTQVQTQEQTQTQPQSQTQQSQTVSGEMSSEPGDYSCFADTAFIGDSRVLGMFYAIPIDNAEFYCNVGMNVNTAISKDFIKLDDGSDGNVVEAVKQHKFKKIILEFGVNELGWSSHSSFQKYYEELIKELKAACPTATIYVQSIIPVTASKSAADEYITNSNVETFNNLVKQAAANAGAKYIDIVPGICGSAERVLPEDASTDGVHLNKSYLYKWINTVKELAK